MRDDNDVVAFPLQLIRQANNVTLDAAKSRIEVVGDECDSHFLWFSHFFLLKQIQNGWNILLKYFYKLIFNKLNIWSDYFHHFWRHVHFPQFERDVSEELGHVHSTFDIEKTVFGLNYRLSGNFLKNSL